MITSNTTEQDGFIVICQQRPRKEDKFWEIRTVLVKGDWVCTPESWRIVPKFLVLASKEI